MSKAFLGPRPSTTFRSPGSMGFNKVICMLALLLPFFGTATQQARAYPVGEPIGTTGPLVGATLTFTASGTLSSIAVLTQGAPNLDFKFVSGGTCATGTAYTTGQTCTVSFTFTPTLPGPRYGGITLTSAAGTLLGSTYIYGIGMGPQANFSPATQTIINTNVDRAVGVVFDGFGNLFVGSEFTGLLELTAASGYNSVINLNNTFVDPIGIAIDGNGNLFVVDHASNTVTELFAGTGYTTTSAIGSGWLAPLGIAIDGTGNLFIADRDNFAVRELTVASNYTQSIKLPGTYNQPAGVALDSLGNLFVVDEGDGLLQELIGAGGYSSATTISTGYTFASGLNIDTNGNIYISNSRVSLLQELTAADGYKTLKTISSGLKIENVALDGTGNIFGADFFDHTIVKFDFADAPTLTFSPTNIGQVSTDSPQIVTLFNNGNADLDFPSLPSAPNPSITPGFTIAGNSSCPQSSASSPPATLAADVSCTYIISFSPLAPGPDNGHLILTDNNLNDPSATQDVRLNGDGTILPPTVASVSPNSGPVAGGTVVTISGSGFSGSTAVSFGTSAAASFTVNSDTSITATTPAGTGTVDVTVTAPGGTSATSPSDLYTYAAPLPQTINFTQPPPAYAGTAVLLSATGGGSTSPVVFSVISGPATVSGTNGSTLTYSGAGTVVVEADQAGDATYAPAPPVQKTITTTILTEPLTTASAAVQTLVTFSTAGRLTAITALTQGKAGGEFNSVRGGDCAIGTTYAAGQTCTADFSFTPAHPGLRYGAVSLTDASGATLGNGYAYGTGNGPQVAWLPGTQTAIGTGISGPTGAAVDGNGNIFLSDMGNNTVEEILASDGSTRVVGSFTLPDDVAVDGSGNVFVISNRTTVSEILAVNGSVPANPTILTLYTTFTALNGMKVDANGNVFVANSLNMGGNSAIYEVLAVNGSIPASPTVVTIVSGIGGPTGVAIDVHGNVYFSDEDGDTVWEVMAVNGVIPPNPVTRSLVSGFIEPTNVALDGAGNLFVPNFGDHTVKEIFAVNGSIPANPAVLTLSTALGEPQGLTVDSAGNVFVADEGVTQLVKLDYADPPSLTFATTDVGSTSTDSPQTVTMINNGNADLVYATPAAGANPSITPGFTIGNGSTCPQLSASSATATLAAGKSCTDVVSFTPITGGPDSGKLITTDNDLSIPGSTQVVPLNGIGIAPAILTLTANPNTAAFGTTVTLTVTATAAPPSTGTPTGTVEFFNSGASLGTVPLSAAGVAVLATSTLPAGTDTITCTYSGDPNFAPATCNPVVVLITAAPSALTIASSVNPSPALTPVTFTAHFSVNGQPAGAGNAITFSIAQSPGVAVLTFPATTDASGAANFTAAGFYPGIYSVSAAFTATGNYQAASAVPVSEIVNLNPTSTTLTASPNPAEQNQTITFVATVTALAGTAPPNGTVTLLDGATVLATASATFGAAAFSTATFAFSTLAPGIHSFSAVYTPLAGNSGVNVAGIPFGTSGGAVSFTASQSSGLSLTITPQDFSLTANPPAITIETQHHATMQLTLTSTGGWTGPITLTCGTVPAWVTCELPASAVTLGADATLPVNFTIDTDQLLGFLASATPPSRPWDFSRIALATLLPLTLLGFTRRRKTLRSLLVLASLAVSMSGLTACGGNFYPQHAAPGVYNIPVTGTGTAVGATAPNTHTLNITLTVTP
ncbi:MAG TPA: Ig-like domain repeat protein [Acidobacteriaceae bacterium]|nr:Ig-like domain repeat protein [Acidobacteriaceae bacterium]